VNCEETVPILTQHFSNYDGASIDDAYNSTAASANLNYQTNSNNNSALQHSLDIYITNDDETTESDEQTETAQTRSNLTKEELSKYADMYKPRIGGM
jgi:hypothetical protein